MTTFDFTNAFRKQQDDRLTVKHAPIDMIPPPNWRALQESVATILRESGVNAEVEKTIQTARGEVTVDVFAHDADATPDQTYLIECKRWRTRVPQTVVHSFQSVVDNAGANWGAIVSLSGFQRGAVTAARYSNVRLLTWPEFHDTFAPKWFEAFFTKTVFDITDPLIEYNEPINSRIFRKADALPRNKRNSFIKLRERHHGLYIMCTMLSFLGLRPPTFANADRVAPIALPLRSTLASAIGPRAVIPPQIVDATSYRELIAAIKVEVDAAVAEFDGLFGERA